MNPYLKILRPLNCLMSGTAVLIVAIIVFGTLFYTRYALILAGFAVTFFTTAGGNILNDYFDLEIDKINHPDRPLPKGEIRAFAARNLAILFFVLAIIVSVYIFIILPKLLSISALIVVILASSTLILYEARLKNRGVTGNVAISMLVMLLFLYGGILFNEIFLLLIFSLMAFFATLGREIIKDIEDVKGDLNRLTLPKRIGIERSGIVAMSMLIIAVSLSPVPYMLGYFNIYYLGAVIVADLLFVYASLIQFWNPNQGQKFSKYAMILGLLSYLVGGLL